MGLQLYNTMSRSIEVFQPLTDKKVGFYGCGPTVYNYAHIGNLRAFVFQDTLARVLEWLGYDVTHVMNITDIGHLSGDVDSGEDKMVRTARERGQSVLDIAAFYTQAFFRDMERLNNRTPSIVCKATDHIGEMIELIKRIQANGHTYQSGGNLYFDIATFPAYGTLALLQTEDLKAGARIEVDAHKRNPHDFVLWFTKSKFENQALTWDSPWGRGYPGWHIECSAMSMKYLGEQFEIHTGGIDHIGIHHTNEIAQSEGATGKTWVRYWLHNEFLVLDKGKMSKSMGNFLTLQTLIDDGFAALDYRFFLLTGHYRSQLTFSPEALEGARNARRNLVARIARLIREAGWTCEQIPCLAGTFGAAQPWLDRFRGHIEQDLSTPRALSELQGLVKDASVPPEQVLHAVLEMDRVLGLNLVTEALTVAGEGENQASDPTEAVRITALITQRTEAKQQKNWALADKIRNDLKAEGVILEDSATGTTWRRN